MIVADEKEEDTIEDENVDENPNKEEISNGKEEKSEKKSKSRKSKKFVFECQECGACCYRTFPIYFEDLKRWSMDQTLQRVYPHLQVEIVQPMGFQITLKKKKDKEGKEVCPFYNEDDNERCDLFFSKPISCVAFPLGYDQNTNRYYLMDKKICPGLGKGTMTNEYLKEMRQNSKLDYKCRIRTLNVLPILQMIFLQFFNQQSQQVMESLSPEDREQLEKILQKSQPEDEQVPDTGEKEEE
jgi:Fe-S-cluster containining protein